MKFWTKGKSQNGYGERGILIKGNSRIISVVKNDDNEIEFMEECDGYFSKTYTKEDSIKLIDELRVWIIKS